VLSAFRSHKLFVADVALLLTPPLVFIAALLAFNVPAQTGWALIVYPFLVLAVSVVGLYVRVYLLRRVWPPRVAAVATLTVFVAGAALFGATVAPWYE
jgi:FtsH-binding integral membrane protein